MILYEHGIHIDIVYNLEGRFEYLVDAASFPKDVIDVDVDKGIWDRCMNLRVRVHQWSIV